MVAHGSFQSRRQWLYTASRKICGWRRSTDCCLSSLAMVIQAHNKNSQEKGQKRISTGQLSRVSMISNRKTNSCISQTKFYIPTSTPTTHRRAHLGPDTVTSRIKAMLALLVANTVKKNKVVSKSSKAWHTAQMINLHSLAL
jgi:hypothetical protein